MTPKGLNSDLSGVEPTDRKNIFFQKLKQSADDESRGDISRELLLFLCTLYELRHLGQTASRLSISIPKASRMLAEARRIFGDPLFRRFGRGLAPTARVSVIVEQARRVLEDMRLLFEEPEFDPALLTRVFRIACLDNAYPIMVEPMLGHLLAGAPRVGVAMMRHDDQTFTRMRAGEVDFGIFPPDQLPEDFEFMPLLKTPYVHVVRPGHPLEAVLEMDGVCPKHEIFRYRRIQIVVHPDHDNPVEGIPGPAPIPLNAGQTVLLDAATGRSRAPHARQRRRAGPPLAHGEGVLAGDKPLTVLGRAEGVPGLEPALIWHRPSPPIQRGSGCEASSPCTLRGGATVVPDE